MGTGIIVCGLNGAGKSTLGRALADALGFYFIDAEDLYFPKDDPRYLYASSRTREEAARLLLERIDANAHFVLASVTGDYGEALLPCLRCAILVEAPKAIRMRRIRLRSFEKFGDRMLPGGDLHEREEAFFRTAHDRPENLAEAWLQTLPCPVIRVDGTQPVKESVARVMEEIRLPLV